MTFYAVRDPDAPIVETERLVLRPFEPHDIGAARFYADPEVMRYIPGGAVNQAELEERFADWVEKRRAEWKSGLGMWAVVFKASGATIGHCGLKLLPDGSDVEVFYLLAKSYWNQGIATEAAKAAIRYGFERANLQRIAAVALPANVGSLRVMEKAGMRREGPARFYDCDVILYSVARGDAATEGVDS
jgi:ribosomal-protein-alanine N-acetyltransferase